MFLLKAELNFTKQMSDNKGWKFQDFFFAFNFHTTVPSSKRYYIARQLFQVLTLQIALYNYYY